MSEAGGHFDAGTQLESLAEFDAHLALNNDLTGCWVQSLDLSGRSHDLASTRVNRTVFLGCTFAPGVEASLEARGALVFPTLPDLPFNPYRAGLYTAAELYEGLANGYRYTLDARAYRWWRHVGAHRSLASELAMTLHDHAMTEALADLHLDVAVGVMGGHALERGSSGYADAARLGRTIAASGRAVITGGGPGAMEAVNLGAALHGSEQDFADALALLATRPQYADDVTAWVSAGFEVADRYELGGGSYGIPTWLYGHEPPNVFSTGIAKLFSNAIREDVLLRLATGGLVCLPGAAGTVQEIFQGVTPRYYATPGEPVPPLVLVGRHYWTHEVPAWPLLQALADGTPLEAALHLAESIDEVKDLVLG